MYKKLPKIDLHCHLDGSLSLDFMKKTLSNEYGEITTSMVQAPADCHNLAEYLKCFDLPIRCLQTAENITAAVCDVLEQAASNNVLYTEIRFAPAFSLSDTLSYKDILEAAIKGCKEGQKRYGIYSNIIVCAMRHLPFKTNFDMLKAAREYLGYGVCALDLAGDEAGFNNELFADLFEEARKLDMPFTIHSGECGRSENIRLAMDFGAKRIGHGIALVKDRKLLDEIKKARIGLELCPTSNYQTKAVGVNDPYPLKAFLDAGLLATINTDNTTVSNTDMNREYELLMRLGLDEKDFCTAFKNSIEIAFADDNVKNNLCSCFAGA